MAARGNRILITGEPKGVFKQVVISGTPKPGVAMTLKSSYYLSGLHQFEPYNRDGDGNRSEVAVLLEDSTQGKTYDDAYADGEIGTVYFPVAGEELNMWFQNQSGTADDVAIGAYFMLDDGTGQLLATSSPESEPFKALATLTDPTADVLLPVMYTGH